MHSWNLTIHFSLTRQSTSEPQPNHISRHTHASPRLFHAIPVHTLSQSSRRIPQPRSPAHSNFLPPPSTPPLGQHAVSRLSSSVLFLKMLRILCLCLSQPRVSGRGKNAALRAVVLPGAAAPRYNMFSHIKILCVPPSRGDNTVVKPRYMCHVTI